jgi:hypothetical protein
MRHPLLAAMLSYVVLAVAVLGPALLPGHTVAPLDILTAVQQWAHAAGRPAPYNPIVSDAAFQFDPWMHFLPAQLHRGNLPGWNPHLLAGAPSVPSGFVSP